MDATAISRFHRRERSGERRLSTFRLGTRRELRVELIDAGGRELIEVRVWFLDPTSGSWRPARDHVAVPYNMFDEFVAAMIEAKAAENRR